MSKAWSQESDGVQVLNNPSGATSRYRFLSGIRSSITRASMVDRLNRILGLDTCAAPGPVFATSLLAMNHLIMCSEWSADLQAAPTAKIRPRRTHAPLTQCARMGTY